MMMISVGVYLSASTHSAKRRKDHGTACVCRNRVSARSRVGHRWVRCASDSDGSECEAGDDDADDADEDDSAGANADDGEDDEDDADEEIEDEEMASAASAPGTGQLKM